MRSLLVVLFGILAVQQALSAVTKPKKTKGPFLGPWLQSNRKQILSSNGKHKAPRNISQAIFAGENEGKPMPWYVLLKKSAGICGGSLVSNRFVISAVGCLYDTDEDGESFTAILGAYSDSQTTERIEFQIAQGDYWFHPDNDNDIDYYDIALIKLTSDVTFNDNVAPIKVWREYRDWTGEMVTFAGMGGYENEDGDTVFPLGLQDKAQEVMEEEWCTYDLEEYYDHDIHFCTAVEGAVGRADWGDDGGPVFIRDESGEPWLIGIISYQPFSVYDAGFSSKHIRLSYYLCYLEETSNYELDLTDDSCTGGGGGGGEGEVEDGGEGGGGGGSGGTSCGFKRDLARMKAKAQARRALKAKKAQKSLKKKQLKGKKPSKGSFAVLNKNVFK